MLNKISKWTVFCLQSYGRSINALESLLKSHIVPGNGLINILFIYKKKNTYYAYFLCNVILLYIMCINVLTELKIQFGTAMCDAHVSVVARYGVMVMCNALECII